MRPCLVPYTNIPEAHSTHSAMVNSWRYLGNENENDLRCLIIQYMYRIAWLRRQQPDVRSPFSLCERHFPLREKEIERKAFSTVEFGRQFEKIIIASNIECQKVLWSVNTLKTSFTFNEFVVKFNSTFLWRWTRAITHCNNFLKIKLNVSHGIV